ncbi:MAG: glycosyltransferase family 2 protein [Gammaproteobacteria bacterium]|nr:glycosyltransferase family 2 protein [Gammaproteobacteria bacterium]
MKLCILVPSLNQPEYLEYALRSILDQLPRQTPTEVRIMDGGSGPKVLKIAERMGREYSELEVSSIADRGQADALARGFDETDADILGWLNSDDLLLPGALHKVLDRFRHRPEVDVIYGDALFIDAGGTCTGAYPTAPFDPELLKSFCYFSQPSVFFRKSAYRQAGGIDATLDYALDYDLWLRMLATDARFAYIPELLSATRLHGKSKTATGQSAFTREVLACQARHFPDSAKAARAVWRSYRKLITAHPTLSRSSALSLAWLLQLVHLQQLPEITAWVCRIARLYLQARRRARPYLGRKFPGLV